MKPTLRLIYVAAVASAMSQPLIADTDITLTQGTSGTWNADWNGLTERTDFIQWSIDLQDWHFAPAVEYGAGVKSYGFTSSTDKFFVRLEHAYIPSADPEGDDYDYDSLSNIDEVTLHDTDPLNWDTDGDGLGDDWEIANNLDPRDDGSINPDNGADGDPDGDGVDNIYEYWNGGNPRLSDTDGDGLSDSDELYVYFTSLAYADWDNDGLNDYAEVITYGTDPYSSDSDEDTLTDGEEVLVYSTNALEMDSDGDWMWDDWELDHGLNPNSPADGLLDADFDTLANQLEFVFLDQGYDPFVTDNPATFPWTGDPDWDGLSTQVQFVTHLTNPMQHDTDGDGFNDNWELANGLNPKLNNSIAGPANHNPDEDPDGDDLTNAEEEQLDTNPFLADTDDDGFNDFEEEHGASNPNDPDSMPESLGGLYALNSPSSSMGPPSPIARVEFTFGDHSISHSEMYRLSLTPLEGDGNPQVRTRTNRKYGQTESRVFYLPKGAKYKVELNHIGTSPRYRDQPKPDYDYTLEVDESTNYLVVADPQGIMGQNDDSYAFFAAGKDATLHVPLFEWITPKGSPVTQPDEISTGKNEFFYDTSAAGELLMNLEVSVKPTGTAGLTGSNGVKFSDRCVFTLPQITGSTFAWDAANVGGKSNADGNNLRAKATYTTLPSLNSEFGLKQAEFTCDGNTDALSNGEFEVFFSKDATNHPGGQTGSPNWFHYWRQFVPFGRIGTLIYNNNIGNANGSTVGQLRETNISQRASGNNVETGHEGLHAFYETLVHESHHITLWEGWWGVGGLPNVPVGSDTDGDNYPNNFETSSDGIAYGFDQNNINDLYNPHTNSAGFQYEEAKCIEQEHLIPDVTIYDGQDWSFDLTIKGKNQ